MIVILDINGVPRKLRIHNSNSIVKWFNSHKCDNKIEDSYIQLLDVLLLRCLNELNTQTPKERNVTIKTIGTHRVTKHVLVYNSKVVMELFPPDIKAITEVYVRDLNALQELTSVAVSSIEHGNVVSISLTELT